MFITQYNTYVYGDFQKILYFKDYNRIDVGELEVLYNGFEITMYTIDHIN